MQKLKAEIELIGINPYILLPDEVLAEIFRQAGKDKGPVPIKGTVNGKSYTQTLVKFKGLWRLYINLKMLENSTKRIGETIELTVAYDPKIRTIPPHDKLVKDLNENKVAKTVFDSLRPSLQHEIVRYISHLKTDASVDKNVSKAIDFLLGNGRFVGRDKP